MAHTFFYRFQDDGTPVRAVAAGSDIEERLCQKAAAEFLMPLKIFKRYTYSHSGQSKLRGVDILKLADIFQTSRQSVAKRLFDIGKMLESEMIVSWKPSFDIKEKSIVGFEMDWIETRLKTYLPSFIDQDSILFDMVLTPFYVIDGQSSTIRYILSASSYR